MVFIGGQLPLDSDDNVVGVGNIKEQARFALTKFKECLEKAGGSMDDVVQVESFHTDPRHIAAVLEVGKEFFTKSKPTWCTVGTTGLYKRAIQVGIRGIAVLNAKTKDINPGLKWYDDAKSPWSVAVPCKVANDLVFIGQMSGMDENGKIVGPGDLLEQSRYAFKKVLECVKLAGGTPECITDVTCYVKDQRAEDTMMYASREFLIKDHETGPKDMERYAGSAFSMLGFFHEDVLGIYKVAAVLGKKTQIPLGKWIPYSVKYPTDIIWAAMKAGRYVFIAGQVMRDPKDTINDPTDELDVPGVKPQARYALHEMKQLLGFLGASMDNVTYITAYHKDCRDMDSVLEVANEFWHNEKPAWISVGQTGLHVKQMTIEIYGMAIVDEADYQAYTD